jgi:tRNA dimethylallyltransferase
VTQARPSVVVIAGPTASGKSDLALALADQFDGVVINADSQQRYRDFPILTAQPSAAECARAPHRLFGDLDAEVVSTAANWAAKAAGEILQAHAAQRLPIVVGGTGLYLKVLMQGVADIPPIPEDIRAASRTLLADLGNTAFHRLLAERDPESAARIPAGNTQRLARAWEVLEGTGTPLSIWHNAPTQPALVADYLPLLLLPAREDLVAACAARFAAMMTAGALAEVDAAVQKGIPHDAPAMNALGARQLADHLKGRLDLETAIRWAETATRQYAKRQSTWFRHQFHSELTIETRYTGTQRDTVVRRVDDFLKRSP